MIKKLQIVILILSIGIVTSILYNYSKFAFTGDYSFRVSTFLHYPMNIFCDFYSLFDQFHRFGYNTSFNYGPSIFIILKTLGNLSDRNPYIAIKILLIIYVISLWIYIFLSLKNFNLYDKVLGTFVLSFCCYPVLFALHTANFEMMCFLLIAYAVLFNIKKRYFIAGVLIGLSASIKIYPALFLFATISRKNYKELITGFAISFLVAFVAGFATGGIVINNFYSWLDNVVKGFKAYNDMMVMSFNGVYFGHSLMNALRIFLGPSYDISNILKPYYIFLFSTLMIGILTTIYSNRIYIKLLIISCCICLLPLTSQDYKLLYFIIPLLFIILSKTHLFIEILFLILISILFVPKNYITFGSEYVTINTILNAVVMSFILIMCIRNVINRISFSR